MSSYLDFAEAALEHYNLGPANVTFVKHNAGMVFHVITLGTNQQYILKIHKRIGMGGDPTAAELEPGLHWLAGFAHACDVTVQTPIQTRTGQFTATIKLPSATVPVACTLQNWVDGHLPNGDFTIKQMAAVGRMTAKIHAFSSTYVVDNNESATYHDTHALQRNVHLLRATLPETLLSAHDYSTICAAERHIADHMAMLGQHPGVWGPVHGDLHHDNILLEEAEVQPIDFTGLRLAHYMYDIGVTMYHIFYQGIEVRYSYFEGYQDIYPLPGMYQASVEAFIAYAAINSLAWNCTIPDQREHRLFKENLDDLVNIYCKSVAEQQPFLFA